MQAIMLFFFTFTGHHFVVAILNIRPNPSKSPLYIQANYLQILGRRLYFTVGA